MWLTLRSGEVRRFRDAPLLSWEGGTDGTAAVGNTAAATRIEFGEAAYRLCRAQRGSDGIRKACFYWVNADRIVIVSEADSIGEFDRPPDSDTTSALFRLADLARFTDEERWFDPAVGEDTYLLDENLHSRPGVALTP